MYNCTELKVLTLAILTATLMYGCGDDVTVNENSAIDTITSQEQLNKCSSANEGAIVYVSDSATVYYCADGNWQSLNGKDGADGEKGETGSTIHDTIVINKNSFSFDTIINNHRDTIFQVDTIQKLDTLVIFDTIVNNNRDTIFQIDTIQKLDTLVILDTTVLSKVDTLYINDTLVGLNGESCFATDTVNAEGLAGINIYCGTKQAGTLWNGKDGNNGTDGKSAYEIAVEKGFTGTEDEWLASLAPSSSSTAKSSSSKAIWSHFNQAISFGEIVDERDGQIYKTVVIGEQTWMAENLNYYYNSGTAKSFCLSNLESNCETYGKLYSWSAAVDSSGLFSKDAKDCGSGIECTFDKSIRGVCPDGWHLPDSIEFRTLYNFVNANNGNEAINTSLKANYGWNSYSGVPLGSDRFGFCALPASSGIMPSTFYSSGETTRFWSSTEYSNVGVYVLYIDYKGTCSAAGTETKPSLASVRCIKDLN